jgi:zinc transport system substrate-binding protein
MTKKTVAVLLVCLLLSLISIACQKREPLVPGGEKITVVATLFPLYDFAKNIGGDMVEVEMLMPPGVETHSFEPRPEDVIKVNKADIFIYTGKYMEPWAEDILKGIDNKALSVVDTGRVIVLREEGESGIHHDHKPAGREHEAEKDPHVWLDFSNARTMVGNILNGFIARDPANRDNYVRNAAIYSEKLADLDRRFREGLSRCKTNTFIHGGHFAFGYLSGKYNLNYISAYKGYAPDSEPTPKRLKELIGNMKIHHLKYVFYEELISPRVADTIAKETGAKLLQLHAAHNLTKEEWDQGATFVSLMEKTLNNLKTGLECQ